MSKYQLAYTAKFFITHGIQEFTILEHRSDGSVIGVLREYAGFYNETFIFNKDEWYLTREDVVSELNQMRDKEIAKIKEKSEREIDAIYKVEI